MFSFVRNSFVMTDKQTHKQSCFSKACQIKGNPFKILKETTSRTQPTFNLPRPKCNNNLWDQESDPN